MVCMNVLTLTHTRHKPSLSPSPLPPCFPFSLPLPSLLPVLPFNPPPSLPPSFAHRESPKILAKGSVTQRSTKTQLLLRVSAHCGFPDTSQKHREVDEQAWWTKITERYINSSLWLRGLSNPHTLQPLFKGGTGTHFSSCASELKGGLLCGNR